MTKRKIHVLSMNLSLAVQLEASHYSVQLFFGDEALKRGVEGRSKVKCRAVPVDALKA